MGYIGRLTDFFKVARVAKTILNYIDYYEGLWQNTGNRYSERVAKGDAYIAESKSGQPHWNVDSVEVVGNTTIWTRGSQCLQKAEEFVCKETEKIAISHQKEEQEAGLPWKRNRRYH